MKVSKRAYHAGDFKNKSESLQVGLHGTSLVSGFFYTTSLEACENQGAGFNLEHKRPVYSFALDGLNLFPTSWQDCKTLNLFNKCLYYWPVYQAYGPADIDYQIYYKPVYNALLDCFEDYYADDVSEDKQVSKFLNELKDGYQIEANDMAEIDGEHYDFSQYIQDNRCLRKLADKLRPIEPDAHNTFPVLSKLMIEGDFDILKSKVNESRKIRESESLLLASILERISANMANWANEHRNDSPDKCAWLEGQANQLFDIAETIQSAGYEQDLIVDIEEIEKNIEEGSGSSDDVFEFARDISQALKDLRSGKDILYESTNLKEDADEVAIFIDHIYKTYEDFIEVSEYATKKQKNIFKSKIQQLYKYNYTTKHFAEVLDDLDNIAKDLKNDEYKQLKKVGKDLEKNVQSIRLHLKHNPEKLEKVKEAEVQYNYEDLKNELENFIDKYELATDIDSMLQKVADLVGIDKKQLIEIANEIAAQYNDLYDKTTGRFNNWSAPKDDLFATQLLIRLGYQGTYPIDDICDSTEWGGAIFHLEDIKAIEPANDIAEQQLGESIKAYRKIKKYF